jgi:hypothetical protein
VNHAGLDTDSSLRWSTGLPTVGGCGGAKEDVERLEAERGRDRADVVDPDIRFGSAFDVAERPEANAGLVSDRFLRHPERFAARDEVEPEVPSHGERVERHAPSEFTSSTAETGNPSPVI